MEEEVRDAVFGNVGTLVSFRVGAEDAEYLEKEFVPEFTAADLVNLAKYDIYLKLMIDGLAGRPFSAETLAPFSAPKKSNLEKIIKVSRERYGTSRKTVEEKISRWSAVLEPSFVAPVASGSALYDAQCSSCKKWVKVPFQPAPNRPVFCKSCLKRNTEKRETAVREVNYSEKEDRLPPPVASSERKRVMEKPKRNISLEELRKTLEESFKKPSSLKDTEKEQ